LRSIAKASITGLIRERWRRRSPWSSSSRREGRRLDVFCTEAVFARAATLAPTGTAASSAAAAQPRVARARLPPPRPRLEIGEHVVHMAAAGLVRQEESRAGRSRWLEKSAATAPSTSCARPLQLGKSVYVVVGAAAEESGVGDPAGQHRAQDPPAFGHRGGRAHTTSRGSAPLSRQPQAPARTSNRVCPLRTWSGPLPMAECSAVRRRLASMPSISGICRSMTTTHDHGGLLDCSPWVVGAVVRTTFEGEADPEPRTADPVLQSAASGPRPKDLRAGSRGRHSLTAESRLLHPRCESHDPSTPRHVQFATDRCR
jgi:hypothetical protein